MAGRRKRQKGGRITRGRLGVSLPRYGIIRNPFHIKQSNPIPHVSSKMSKMSRMRWNDSKVRYVHSLSPMTANGQPIIIRGQIHRMYTKGRKLVTTPSV